MGNRPGSYPERFISLSINCEGGSPMKHVPVFLVLCMMLVQCGSRDSADTRKIEEKILTVSASSLTLRDAPGKDAAQIMQLFQGRAVKAIAETVASDTIDGITAKWFKVVTNDGKSGYVFGGHLRDPEICKSIPFSYKEDKLLAQHRKKNSGNYWEGYKELEESNLLKFTYVSRNDTTLTIKLDNNQTLTYEDYKPGSVKDEPKVTKHYFREQLPNTHYCIVSIGYYEGSDMHLINLKNGAKSNLWDVPVALSPDNSYCLVTSTMGQYKTCGIQIFRLSTDGPDRELEVKTKWSPINAVWLSNSLIELVIQSQGNNCRISKARIIKTGSTWTIED
jgi:hypothetical protein